MPNICVIQFNVSDMDEAIDFYGSKLGFGIKSKEHYPDLVQLEHEGTYALLCKVDRAAQIDYPNEAQTLVNIQTNDLRKAMVELKEKGVELIHAEPQTCPVGIYAAFRDPFGNVIELLEFGGTVDAE